MKAIIIVFVFALVYANKQGLVQLNKSNHELVLKQNKNVIVKFFSPYCPHCVRFSPIYSEFAVKMQNEENLIVAELNCVDFRDLCGFYKIRGYPTVNFYHNGEFVERFGQQRTVDNLVEFSKKNMK
ncbi:thioredoxin, putative [Entamoeba histolytica KU27]|uniref:Thioredoxin, putative n=1 Tax=Entamoeba histolytica KU27 TaxID=885311 RepID=M2Q010_ENTHI|nr:thioredoxin, putative [Entamoeba histolytica KU27]